jgi:multiple sugar transport system substrate-binding protein
VFVYVSLGKEEEMEMTKKVFVILVSLLASLLCIFLVVQAQQDEVTLLIHPTLFAATGGPDGVIAQFTRETGIKVIVVTAPTDQLRDKALMEFIAGTGRFNVITLQNAWMNEEMLPFLEPLDPYLSTTEADYDFDDIIASLVGIATINGKLAAIPFRAGTTMLYYRTDILEKYGVSVPESFDEFVQALKGISSQGEGVYGTVLRGKNDFQMSQEFDRYLFALGGNVLNDTMTSCLLNSPEGIRAIEIWAELFQGQSTPPDTLALGRDDLIRMMQTGRIAMTIAYSPYYGRMIEGIDPNLIGWALVPSAPGVPRGRSLNVLWSLGMDRNSSNKQAAWKLIEYLTNKQNQLLMAVDYANGPARASVFQDPTYQEKWPMAEDLLAATAASEFEPPHPRLPEISHIMAMELANAMLKRITPEEAAARICTEIDALLAE